MKKVRHLYEEVQENQTCDTYEFMSEQDMIDANYSELLGCITTAAS